MVLVFAFAGFVVLRRSQVSAQTVNVKITPTNVGRVVLAKVNPLTGGNETRIERVIATEPPVCKIEPKVQNK